MSGILNGLIGSFAPAAAPAFESIATLFGNNSSTAITFSGIPNTYKHLQIRMVGRNDSPNFGSSNLVMRFNQNTTGYAFHRLNNAAPNGFANQSGINLTDPVASGGSSGGIVGVGIIDILDYSSTTKQKTMKSVTAYNAAGNNSMSIVSGQWRNTSAIDTIVFISGDGAFTSETQIALYGIKG